MARRLRLSLLLLSLWTTACGGVTGAHRATFDAHALNGPWYGAYHRPLADPGAPREGRSHREEQAGDAATRAERRHVDRAERRAIASSTPAQPELDPSQAGFAAEAAVGYVRDVYALNEAPIGDEATRAVVDVYRFAQEHGTIYHNTRPAVGDLVFFHNTADANGDTRHNDWFTHVGIVERVDAAGTVSVLSYVGGAVRATRMNLEQPATGELGGETINSRLRPPSRRDATGDEGLAASLFAGFASLLGDRAEVTVLDRWSPDASPSLHATR